MILFDQHTHCLDAPVGQALVNIPLSALRHPDSFVFVEGQHYSAGLFPLEEVDDAPFLLHQLAALLDAHRIEAVGECGLDVRSAVPMTQQVEWFEAQMALADRMGAPLIIHCVKAWQQLAAIVRRHPAPAAPRIVHGFRGKPQLAQQLLAQGFHLSFGPHFNPQSLRLCPPDRLHIETDAADTAIQTVHAAVLSARETQIYLLS